MQYLLFAPSIFAAIASVGYLLFRLHRDRVSRFPGAVALPGLVAALISPLSLFLSIVAGGTLGGAYGEYLALILGFAPHHKYNATGLFIVAGINVGIWLAFTLPEVLCVGLIGLLILKRRTRPTSSIS